VGYTEDVFEALEIQDKLQTLYTSGTVFHTFLGEKLPDWKAAATLVRKIAENHELPYYTLSPTYSVCADHGYLAGEQYTCPHCGKKTEVYSRITGYYRPVQNWNDGKSQEYKDRKTYQVAAASAPVDRIVVKAEKVMEVPAAPVAADAKITLISRVTCPNCKVAENLLNKAGVSYEKLIAEENLDLCRKLDVKGAPTLVISQGDSHTLCYGVPEIKKYIASL